MCLLTVFPMPDLLDERMIERLENGAWLNPDGSGWAVIQGDRIVTGRSLKGEVAVEGFVEAYARATGPALFHSRWATHGQKNLSNVHPFPVRKLRDTYVAHNGIMPSDSWPEVGDFRSDTRVFADDILPIKYRRLDSPKVRAHLHHWLDGNKIAILSTDPKLERNLYMFGMAAGEWVDGVWFSNSDHEGYKYRWQLGTNKHEDRACEYCYNKTVNAWAICETCGTCQDCSEPDRNCQCFTPDDATPSTAYQSIAKDWKTDAEGTPTPTVIGPANFVAGSKSIITQTGEK